MSKFKVPTNIKQIGSIDNNSNLKIYIDDCANNYLQQYIKAGNYNDRLAFLIGQIICDENNEIIVCIVGAIKALHTEYSDGILNITPQTYDYINNQIKKYFPDSCIVGLAQSQPGYGTYLNEKYVTQFKNNFTEINQVMFVCDPIEKINAFYIFDDARENLFALNGYFIFYKKNDAMSEYIIANKKIDKVTFDESYNSSDDELDNKNNKPKKNNRDQKKIVNMLASLSAVLFLICFVMGAGLVQNEDRISKLENKIQVLNNLYKNMNNAESVFSFQEPSDQKKSEELNSMTPKIIKDIENKTSSEKKSQESQTKLDVGLLAQNDETNFITPNSFETQENHVKPSNINKNKDEEKIKKIPDTYTVREGDSLSSISIRFFDDISMMQKIMDINNMDNPDKIYIGKVLKLPKQ
jgi:LysM repeat protein